MIVLNYNDHKNYLETDEFKKKHFQYLLEIRRLNIFNYFYHELDSPTIEDVEYDRLYKTVMKFEEEYPAMKSSISPTNYCGSPPLMLFMRMWDCDPSIVKCLLKELCEDGYK